MAQLRGQQEPSLCRGKSQLIRLKRQEREEIEQRKQDKQPGNEGENGWMNQQAGQDKKEIQRRRAYEIIPGSPVPVT